MVDTVPKAGDNYTCHVCGDTFKAGWADTEALDEKNRDFPDVPLEECMVVCDPCYKEIMGKD